MPLSCSGPQFFTGFLCFLLILSPAQAEAPLTLAAAIETALSANKALIGARLMYESEQHALASAQSEFDVRIVPSVSLGRLGGDTGYEGSNSSVGVSLNKKFIQGTQLSLGPSYNQTASGENTTLNASLHQPLLRGLGRDVGADPLYRAEYVLDAARRNVEQTRSDIALDTIVAYYEVLRQEQLLALHRLVRDRLTRHALMARGKEKVGLANPMATYRAELRLNDAEEQVAQAGYGLENAKNRLKQLLEWPLEREFAIQPASPPALPDADLEQVAVELRPDLKQLRADIEEAERNVKLAENRVLPDLNLIVNYGQVYSTDPALTQSLSTSQQQWGVYLQASTDLYRSTEKEALRRARLRVESLRLTFETRLQEVARALRQQRLQLEEAGKRTRLRQDQIRVAEGKLALAETKFMHDLADNFDVIEAEIELQRARVSLLGSQIEHAVGTYRLWAAANQLLERAPWKPGVGH